MTDVQETTTPPLPPLPILHLDDDLVIVSKPAGMMVHRDAFSGPHERYLLQTLSTQIGRYIFPVHRLDRATSGVIAFALSRENARVLHESLKSESTRKEYLVLCRGETPESFVADRPLSNENGQRSPARTEFRRLAFFSRSSLLEARISTGRRHQIRRHLNHLAHQVIGDSSYGKGRINAFFRETYGLPRMFLHARRLVVPHPCRDEILDVSVPLPDDLREFLSRLPDVEDALLEEL